MKVLIGSTNPSKVKRFQELLQDYDCQFVSLSELGISGEPEENGVTPLENAIIKAKYYGQFYDYVICNDSGLYIDDIPLDDPRQPGLSIKRPCGTLLSEEGMITYYANLAKSLGGVVTCYYQDAIAVYNHGTLYQFIDDTESNRAWAFDLVDTPHPIRHLGWPLDSISKRKGSGQYFVEEDDTKSSDFMMDDIKAQYERRLISFLIHSLDQ